MLSNRRLIGALMLLLGTPVMAFACLWDYDTLKQERARFPSTLELITGKFLRHSKEFYEWRIRDRLSKLVAAPSNVALYDDLAVAYAKTGQHDKAIATMLAKEKIKPGLYETYSNLGTFHILTGDFEAGLPYIDQALVINPDAHFGRERYQKWLIEYALSRREKGKLVFPLKMSKADIGEEKAAANFYVFVGRQPGTRLEPPQWEGSQAIFIELEDLQKAVKGVLGMMRFANHDNPLLLEALGDLLSYRGPGYHSDEDAKQLATRSYLKASYEVKDAAASQGYRKSAQRVLYLQTRDPRSQVQLPLAELEAAFAVELAEAESWYADLREKEIGWIRGGKDVEAEFDRLYPEEREVPEPWMSRLRIIIGCGLGALVLMGMGLFLFLKRQPRTAT